MYLRSLIACMILQSCSSVLLRHASVSFILFPYVSNGRPAKLGDVPYQVAFKQLVSDKDKEYTTFCGGVIIAPQNILTAAHCFEWDSLLDEDGEDRYLTENKLDRIYAVAGNILDRAQTPASLSWPLVSPGKLMNFNMSVYLKAMLSHGGGQWRSLAEGVYPKNFKFPRADIAVIKVRTPFQYNNHVRPIPIATTHREYNSMTCLVSGYGETSNVTSNSTNHLLLADLKILPTYFCNLKHQKNMKNFVCSTRVSDISKGDSGGPLVCKGTGDPNDKGDGVLVGIVSGHSGGVGSFFTRVSSYTEFIKKNSATSNTYSIVYLMLIIYISLWLF